MREYVEEMRPQISKLSAWESPRELGVTTNVDPLLGKQKLRRVVSIYGSILLALLLVLLSLGRIVTAS